MYSFSLWHVLEYPEIPIHRSCALCSGSAFLFLVGDEIYLQCIALLVEFGADINHIAVTHPGHGKNKANHVCDIHLHSLFTVVKDRAWSELCAAESCEDLSSIQ